MKSYRVTWRSEVSAVIRGESREAVERAAARVTDADLAEWDAVEWDVTVSREPTADAPDMGVAGGKVAHLDDCGDDAV